MKPGEIMREALLGAAISIGLGPVYAGSDRPPAYVGALYGQPDADAEAFVRAQAEIPALPPVQFLEVNRELRRALGIKNQAAPGQQGGIHVNTAGYELYETQQRLQSAADSLASIALMRTTWR